MPRQWKGSARRIHAAMGGLWKFDANRWLSDAAHRVSSVRIPIDAGDDEIRQLAGKCAREAMAMAAGPVRYTVRTLRARLDGYVARYGIRAPAAELSDAGAVSRMTDPYWWRRALRREQGRAIEHAAIDLGFVSRRREPYASDLTVQRRASQRRRNAATLDATDAVNLDTGEILRLADLAAASVANPAIRRGELMTRIKGFEGCALAGGHAADFVTLTCPSSFHAQRIGDGGKVERNPRWSGATPREAQAYLNKVWARTRAAWHRKGVRPYGFRIAEPHHDGTPHWHLILFVGHEHLGEMRAIFERYALELDGDEAGARRNRIDFKAIDWTRGTAAGYVAKYVAKNIDGWQVQGDFEAGMDAVTGSARVEAWAAAWGIRQFQQVGGPPVGVWRELRRLRDADESHTEAVAAARAAADAGNWHRYVDVQGGASVARDDVVIRTAYTRPGERWDAVNGCAVPAPLTRYREPAPAAVYGVRDVRMRREYCSRLNRWEIRRRGGSRLASGGICAGGEIHQSTVAPRGLWGSRTRVNNCTGPAWVVGAGDAIPIPESADERETRESWERWRRHGTKGNARKGDECQIQDGEGDAGGIHSARSARSAAGHGGTVGADRA